MDIKVTSKGKEMLMGVNFIALKGFGAYMLIIVLAYHTWDL